MRTACLSLLIAVGFLFPFLSATASVQTQNSSLSAQEARERWPDGVFKWTTADSISVRYYSVYVGAWAAPLGSPIEPSPDGRYFYVLSARGELRCMCNVQTLEVFDTQRVRGLLAGRRTQAEALIHPLRKVEMRGTHNPPPMVELHWSETSDAIQFFGTDAAGVVQAYRLEILSGKLEVLTNDTSSKDAMVPSKDVLLYRRTVPVASRELSEETSLVPARRNAAGDLELRWGPPAVRSERYEWVASYRDGESWVLPIDEMLPVADSEMLSKYGVSSIIVWFAPDGRRAVIALQDILQHLRPVRFVFVDFAKRQVRSLSEVALGGQKAAFGSPTTPQVLWTSDSKQAILVNTALPREEVLPEQPLATGYVASYDVESGRWQNIEALSEPGSAGRQVRALGWLKTGKELLITHEITGRLTSGTVYAKRHDRWVGHSVSAVLGLPPATKTGVLPGGLTVTIRQSANDPPTLIAAEAGRERILSTPDPALKGIWLARQEPFTWRTPSGQSVTGGLSLPRSVPDGAPVPLVIQVGDYYPELFLPDGHVPSGYAQQALNAQGMAVLRIEYRDLPGRSTPKEGSNFVERIEAAVDALARQGKIDPQHVGAIGHSRAGFLIHYAITHPGRLRLAAAEVWDSWTGSYGDYLQSAIGGSFIEAFQLTNGGQFWQNKEAWLENEVLFNAERVETPTLFTAHGQTGAVSTAGAPVHVHMMMLMGAYRITQRPVEFLSVPFGGHILPRVRDRKPALDVSLDWMRFWLQGKEDASADKAEQYARWRQIRRRQEQQHTNAPQMISQVQSAPHADVSTVDGAPVHEAELQRVREEMKAYQVEDVSDATTLNNRGYQALYEEGDADAALRYFRWNLVLFPKYAAHLYDSLGEAYLQVGDREQAIENYVKSLRMSPNPSAKVTVIVARLRADASSLKVLQQEAREAYRAVASRRSSRGK